MKCPTCGAQAARDDNFCPRCGTSMRNSRLPVRVPPASPPAIWERAAPAVARGVVLVAAGVIGEWLLHSATRRAARLPVERVKAARNGEGKAVVRREDAVPEGAIAVSETFIVRRIIFRQR